MTIIADRLPQGRINRMAEFLKNRKRLRFELCLKGLLRSVGIEPPNLHDVGSLILEHRGRFEGISLRNLKKIAKISKELRKERVLAFYGDIDFLATEEYTKKDAIKAMKMPHGLLT